MAHALTIVERVAEPAVYEKARDAAINIGQAERNFRRFMRQFQ
jgi:hypothetical protein